MSNVSYTMTNDVITVVDNGKTYMSRKGSVNFNALRDSIVKEDWDKVRKNLTVEKAVYDWAKGDFKLVDDRVFFQNEHVPEDMENRILKMASNGENPISLIKFWERLKKNPSWRSVTQLYSFLNKTGIPLTKDGTFLAYKSVNNDYLDHHTGTVKNVPGTTVVMDRNKISDDPKEACHYGLHVGALGYVKNFHSDGRIIICEVDPADVVCVPYDAQQEKMRVCKYKVIGNHNGQSMSSTSVDDDFDVEIDEEFEENGDVKDKASVSTIQFKISKKYAKIHSMTTMELFEQTTEKLRDYATNGLKIVGASKIPGGKMALIDEIEKIRENTSMN